MPCFFLENGPAVFVAVSSNATKNRIVIAVYNYQSREATDVSFVKGDRMEVLDDRYNTVQNYL